LLELYKRTNSIMENPKFYCKNCDFSAAKLCHWKEHILTKKHSNKSQQKFPAPEFYCEACDVKCSHSSILIRHKKTAKHIKTAEAAKISGQSKNVESQYVEIINKLVLDNQRTTTDNQELRNFIVEQSKTIEKIMIQNTEVMSKALDSNKIINSNNTINNNNKFNINIFLNEQCKDALNFTEFVKNIEISYQDLENNAQLGFVQGISKIFMDNLKQLGINERPIHCTDVKRETMYIKDEDKWTKEVDDSKLQKAIQTVSYKSMGKLMEWKQENPDYQDADSEFSKRCMDIQRQSLAGSDREVYYPKVIHVLAKETMVDK
jgi:hypothetical protein